MRPVRLVPWEFACDTCHTTVIVHARDQSEPMEPDDWTEFHDRWGEVPHFFCGPCTADRIAKAATNA